MFHTLIIFVQTSAFLSYKKIQLWFEPAIRYSPQGENRTEYIDDAGIK